MRKLILLSAIVCLLATAAFAQGKGPVGPPGGNIWADGTAYRTIGTPTNLPNNGPKDGLFVFQGLDGQSAVSESKPGDADYNGGRWQVYVVEFTEAGLAVHDANNDDVADFELTSWEMVQQHIALGHLQQVGLGPSLECPLIRK